MSSPPKSSHPNPHHRRAFTLTEVLIVIAVVVILIGLLLPALGGVWKQGLMTRSMSNMKQIGDWMHLYTTENADFILPSQFDYSANPYPGKVRQGTVNLGQPNTGTWTDILWTINEVSTIAQVAAGGGGTNLPNYEYDSPDQTLYDVLGEWDGNPFRSVAPNTRDAQPGVGSALPRPFGMGANEQGSPGYFAANDFFNADPDSPDFNGWFTIGQIRFPDQSMYLVDSFAGEIIQPICEPFDRTGERDEVDFRYGDVCLMLMLDGHVEPQGKWQTLDDLQGYVNAAGVTFPGRDIRIQNLTVRGLPLGPVCP